MKCLTLLMLTFMLAVELQAAWLQQNNKKVDCAITHWGVWGNCILNSGNGHYKQRRRSFIQPKNGGKECPTATSLRETIACSEGEIMAATFMTSLTSPKMSAPTRSYRILEEVGRVKEDCPVMKAGSSMSATGACGYSSRRRREITKRKHFDLLFLLDESGSIGFTRYQAVKNLAANIVSALDGTIAPASDQTRIAMSTFDKINHPKFNFDDFFDKVKLRNKILGASYSSATDSNTCMTNALEHARDHMFVPARGVRSSSSTDQVIIMITDGCANCATKKTLENMRRSLDDQGISIMILHIGSLNVCLDKLRALSDGTKCFQLYNMATYEALDKFSTALSKMKISDWKHSGFNMECKSIQNRIN